MVCIKDIKDEMSDKNRNRDQYTFANINFLGKCNVDCFFCLGKDIEELLCKQNQMNDHFSTWKNIDKFLDICKQNNINKLYLTGQNTDPLLYKYLDEIIENIQSKGFSLGIRTNGYRALAKMDSINTLKEEIGYSIHTLSPTTNKMILGRADIPDWENIINKSGNNVRVSIVVNRCNREEIWDILKFLSKFPNIRYIQIRRVSTDTRLNELAPDISAYETFYTEASKIFPLNRKFVTDAEEYVIYDKPVVFWRTIKTSVNSLNYFSDGTISDLYFIVEGYLRYNDTKE